MFVVTELVVNGTQCIVKCLKVIMPVANLKSQFSCCAFFSFEEEILTQLLRSKQFQKHNPLMSKPRIQLTQGSMHLQRKVPDILP